MSDAVISDVQVAAGHDGVAELVVTLRHGNGGTSRVSLDEMATAALLQACEASEPGELLGHRWDRVRDALAVSWNRYNPPAMADENLSR
jgi:hypothetical protein